MFNSDQSVATRPKILSTSPALGSTITVTTDSAVTKFSMVRFGTATHSVNTDLIRVPLLNTASGITHRNQVLSEPGVVIPGW